MTITYIVVKIKHTTVLIVMLVNNYNHVVMTPKNPVIHNLGLKYSKQHEDNDTKSKNFDGGRSGWDGSMGGMIHAPSAS